MKLLKDSFNNYLSAEGYASASALKKLKRSPLHFKEQVISDTDALIFGRLYHTFILEPEQFDKEYYVFNDADIIEKLKAEGSKNPRATNFYKSWLAGVESEAEGKTMIDLTTFEKIRTMKERLFSDPIAKYLLLSGRQEVSGYGQINGVNVKIRMDSLSEKKRFIADLKTVADASEDGFIKKYVAAHDGHIQAGIYTDFMEQLTGEPHRFFWVAQEKEPPFAVAIYKASTQMLSVACYEYEMLLEQWQYCKDSEKYEGYEVFCDNKFHVKEIDLPNYSIKDYSFNNKRR